MLHDRKDASVLENTHPMICQRLQALAYASFGVQIPANEVEEDQDDDTSGDAVSCCIAGV